MGCLDCREEMDGTGRGGSKVRWVTLDRRGHRAHQEQGQWCTPGGGEPPALPPMEPRWSTSDGQLVAGTAILVEEQTTSACLTIQTTHTSTLEYKATAQYMAQSINFKNINLAVHLPYLGCITTTFPALSVALDRKRFS